jgi:hypothetical protein
VSNAETGLDDKAEAGVLSRGARSPVKGKETGWPEEKQTLDPQILVQRSTYLSESQLQ